MKEKLQEIINHCDSSRENLGKWIEELDILIEESKREIRISTPEPFMSDMNGEEIVAGDTIMYQVGSQYESTCKVKVIEDELWLTDWSDDNGSMKVKDTWYQKGDSKITKIIKS